MSFLQSVLDVLNTKGAVPGLYGWYHIMWLAITVAVAVGLCLWQKKVPADRQRMVVLITAVVVVILEIYKQINYSFSYADGISFSYQWYAFPFQFCSTPMYVGLLAGLLPKGKVSNALMSYLATFAVFAGLCVMIYPGDVFVDTVGINIQTMICHGSMVWIGIYLLHSGKVKLEHKTVLKGAVVFAVCVILAVTMNEIAYQTGLLESHTFNMFFISPYCTPSLPVYSLVQGVVPFPWSLVIYIVGFTLASWIILLVAMGISKLAKKKVVA